MALQLNDTAPDFEAETTEGKIRFHDWIGDKWVVLFSHPKDFTPVCTTELGYMAKIKPEFDKRGVKIIGLSVDPVDKHAGWANDIKETQGFAPNYPMIGDTDFNVSKLYGMLPASVSGDPAKRTAADNQTVRNVFVIGPDKKVKLILVYPMTTGRNFDEVLRVIELAAAHRQAQGGNAGELEARRRRDHRRLGHRRGCQEAVPAGLEGAEALHPHCAAAEGVRRIEQARLRKARCEPRLLRYGPTAVARYCSPLSTSHASSLVHPCTRPHTGHNIVAFTLGSSSTPDVSIPVETSRPVAGQWIMIIPMIPSSPCHQTTP